MCVMNAHPSHRIIMATETIEQIETCENCRFWDNEWFRKPEDDEEGKGLRFCNVHLYHINDNGIHKGI